MRKYELIDMIVAVAMLAVLGFILIISYGFYKSQIREQAAYEDCIKIRRPMDCAGVMLLNN